MTDALFGFAIVVAALTAVARLSVWRTAPQTRLLTAVLALLAASAAFAQTQISDRLDAYFDDPGWSGIGYDVLLLTAVCLLCAYLAQIWGHTRLARAAELAAPALAALLTITYALAEHNGQHRHYIGEELSSTATVHGLLVSGALLLANVVMAATVVAARPPTRTQLWFGLAALAGLIVATLRISAIIDPGRFSDAFWDLRYPLDTVVLLAVSAAGIDNLLRKRRSKAALNS
ncbi:hypothetical protein DFR70_102940 [Nocardia tenerifensis]|uniref:Uncharacterized protein n=1 Tax=Nocardia tenerifensis TaxID=228006 RepID=A0A318KWW1_9NOCA|nr:hypothetical protein [Nocardia tenerifensis]PXX69251.1 hypothetical protein DFR70_102940 [Nocardia tenerifensis]